MTIKEFHKVCEVLRDIISGTEFENHVYCVGGCIRDEVLGRPVKDVDIAVDLPNGGIRLAEWLWHNGYLKFAPVKYPVYSTAQFHLLEFPDLELEAVQTRKEKYEDRSNRNPVTAYGTIEEDCLRRDLTINSLYKNVTTGEILDITGSGIDDIHNKVVRTPVDPDETFDDDPLRMLRCIRFATRYEGDWKIEQETWDGIVYNASRLAIITRERICDELFKMLDGYNPAQSIWLMTEAGLADCVFSVRLDLNDCVGICNTLLKLSSNTELVVKLAGIMHHLEFYEEPEDILKNLKCSNEVIKTVKNYLWLLEEFSNIERTDKEARIREVLHKCKNKETFDNCCELFSAIYTKDDYIVKRLKEQVENDMADGISMFGYKVPVNGNDIMQELDIKPGVEVRKYLDYAFNLCCKDPKMTREEVIRLLKKIRQN